MKKVVLLFIIVLIVIFIDGCATLFAPKLQSLSVSSDPNESIVYVNGLKMGITPVELELKADKSYTIEFRKDGYQSITRVVDTKIGPGWIVLDVLGGGIPVIVDAVTGAWNQLDQDSVNAVLEKQNK